MTLTQAANTSGLSCTLTSSSIYRRHKDVVKVSGISGEELEVSFHRTIRVPDGDGDSELPPSMGTFPLYAVACHEDKLPSSMALKGGLFFPMYQREAMWIQFKSSDRFAIKIHLGGVNAVSGEPMIENAATKLRRLSLMAKKKSIQDYVVTPDQLWLDGIASNDGRVRQFVAMPLGSGYSVEAQITGEEVVGGLQFEITPAPKPPLAPLSSNLRYPAKPGSCYPVKEVYIKTLTGKTLALQGLSPSTGFKHIKKMINDMEGIPPDQQRLISHCRQLDSDRTLGDYNIPDQAQIHLVLRLRGGGPSTPKEVWDLGVAPGGLIKQCILQDKNHASIWNRKDTVCFNVQILNSEVFRQVTGEEPPATPITAETYASNGLPFFKIYEEESNVKGNFEGIKSVKAIDKAKATAGHTKGYKGEHNEAPLVNLVILLNSDGTPRGFRPVSELEKELSSMNAVQF